MSLYAKDDNRIDVFRAAECLKDELCGKPWFESISVVKDYYSFQSDRLVTIYVFASDPDAPEAKTLKKKGFKEFRVHVMKREDFRKNTCSDFKGSYQGGQIWGTGMTLTDDGAHGFSVPVMSEDGKYGFMICYVRDGVLRIDGRPDEKVFNVGPEWRLS